MGLEQSRPPTVPVSVPVMLHIYDMGKDPEVQAMNRVLKALGTGAFHCGAEIYGREWSFRGRRNGADGTGIFWCRPRLCEGHTYHESLHVGISHMSEDEVFNLISRLQGAWLGKQYDVLKNNCCHFVDSLCRLLGVDGLPSWVMSLAGAGAAITDAAECLEERSTSLAIGVATTIRGVKDNVVLECKERLAVDCSDAGCISNAGCMADIGSMPSLCVQSARPVYRTSSNTPEFVDVVAESTLVQKLLPSCAPPVDNPGPAPRSPHSVQRPEEMPSPGACGVRAQLVPRSRAGASHARYMPQEAPVVPERPPAMFAEAEPLVNMW